MGKRKKWQYIMDLEVQDLKGKMTFSSKDLVWAEINTKNNGIDCVAVIPLRRVADFIKGEEENPIAPCKFVRKTNNQNKELPLDHNMKCEYFKNALFRSFETTFIFLCMY